MEPSPCGSPYVMLKPLTHICSKWSHCPETRSNAEGGDTNIYIYIYIYICVIYTCTYIWECLISWLHFYHLHMNFVLGP